MTCFLKKNLRQRSGMSLAELLTVMGIMSLIVTGTTSMLIHSSRSSDRTQTQNEVDNDVALAAEQVTQSLLEARTITIDADGMGITYYYPELSEDGTQYTSNATATDAVSHRLFVSNGRLCSSDSIRPILTNIPPKDPETNATLTVFTSGVSNRFIIIRLAMSKTTTSNSTVFSALTIRLRPRNL